MEDLRVLVVVEEFSFQRPVIHRPVHDFHFVFLPPFCFLTVPRRLPPLTNWFFLNDGGNFPFAISASQQAHPAHRGNRRKRADGLPALRLQPLTPDKPCDVLKFPHLFFLRVERLRLLAFREEDRRRFIFERVRASLARRPVFPPFLAAARNFLFGIGRPFFAPSCLRSAPLFLLVAFWIHLLAI